VFISHYSQIPNFSTKNHWPNNYSTNIQILHQYLDTTGGRHIQDLYHEQRRRLEPYLLGSGDTHRASGPPANQASDEGPNQRGSSPLHPAQTPSPPTQQVRRLPTQQVRRSPTQQVRWSPSHRPDGRRRTSAGGRCRTTSGSRYGSRSRGRRRTRSAGRLTHRRRGKHTAKTTTRSSLCDPVLQNNPVLFRPGGFYKNNNSHAVHVMV
jgi:hypothetical protein